MASKKYPTKTVPHLFWNKYAYKVVLDLNTYHTGWRTQSARDKELKTILAKCPDATSGTWRLISGWNTATLFFEHEHDYQSFKSKQKSKIREVWEPLNAQQTKMMVADEKLVFRDTLYYGKYTWCVTLGHFNRTIKAEIRDWAEHAFETDTLANDRVRFSDGLLIRFYLSDDSDVVLVKLAQGSRIKKIEKAILKTTITNTEAN